MVLHASNPDTEEAEVEDCYIREASLAYISRPWLKKPSSNKYNMFTLCI